MKTQKTTTTHRNSFANVTPKRNYKDTLFRLLFLDKKELLALYNALNHSHYTDPEQLEIKTLENAIYLNMKNDLAFLLDDRLCMYEHQSTRNPNLPLRFLHYVSEVLQAHTIQENIYSKTLIKIPTPEFVVFYNGAEVIPDVSEQRLSELYLIPQDNPKLELIVKVLNINIGHNKKLMESCPTLYQYAIYVNKVREYSKQMELKMAVDRAIKECIENDVLRDFLLKQRLEAINVTIYEFDQELYEKTIRKEEREEERIRAIQNMLEFGVAESQILEKYTKEELETAKEAYSN